MIDDEARRLVNPYLRAPERPAVRGVTLGRVGAVAAGVLAVAVPAVTHADQATTADVPPSRIEPGAVVWLGEAGAVQSEVDELCMPSGYLFPCAPAELAPSPALR